MTRSTFNPWLHRFAVLTALCTLGLLGVGGVVTSKGVGMAVPDWPTTYGYNMFFFPISKWTGGIFYEHSHRLAGSLVGLLTMILAVWLWWAEGRRWLRWLGVATLLAVVGQGVLGGLRVVLYRDEIGIFHATLAQLFFSLVCAIALFTSRWWLQGKPSPLRPSPSDERGERSAEGYGGPGPWFLVATILIFFQLILGATMRHQHAGLAVPDFPLAYGRPWPALDAAAIATYNARRSEARGENPITASHIQIHMAHRAMAVAILAAVALVVWQTRRRTPVAQAIRRLSIGWLGLILVQAGLGAWTVWSNKAADIATAHVLVGALSLVTGVLGCLICFRRIARVTAAQGAPSTGTSCTELPVRAA